MARIRTVKPEFWKHEALSALPEATHMLAAALLNYADDEGYFNANPKLVQAECCPLREPSVSIHESLTHLSNVGYLRLGTDDIGRTFGHIVNFGDHQRVNRPTPSKIKTLQIAWEHSLRAHGALTERSPPEGKGKEQGTGKGKESVQPNGSTHEPIVDLDAALFRFGVSVLGEKNRSVVAKLKKCKGTEQALHVLERARTRENPLSYVTKVCAGKVADDAWDGIL